jgi:hypothetical protein
MYLSRSIFIFRLKAARKSRRGLQQLVERFYLLNESQNVLLMAQVTMSLTGWAASLRLLPYPNENSRDHTKSYSPEIGRVKNGEEFTQCNILCVICATLHIARQLGHKKRNFFGITP